MLLLKQNQLLLNRRILGLHQQFKQPNAHDDILNASGGNLVFHKIDQNMLSMQAHLCNRMMERARREHIVNNIHENENDAGKLWRAVNSVLYRVPTKSMPTTSDITTLCHSFSTFFVNKK